MDENVNIRQEAKPITLKAILKRPNLETINEKKKADVNLRRGLNLYQYNVIDDFYWTLIPKVNATILSSSRKKKTKECESSSSKEETSL